MTILEAPDVGTSPMGIVFWWEDWDNYYAMYYWANGWLDVRRVIGGEEKTLITRDDAPLEKGVGQTNHIELDLTSRRATVYVNGTEVTRFRGKPPKDGGIIGFQAVSSANTPGLFGYDNLVVSEPAE